MGYSIGIDYSMTSPAITVINNDSDCCDFHFLISEARRNKSKFYVKNNQYRLFPTTKKEPNDFPDAISRYVFLSNWALSILNSYNKNEISSICLEGYSYGSTGARLFQIAENTAILKYELSLNGYCEKTKIIPPTVVKKLATGKGNANKEMMEQAFISLTGLNFREYIPHTKNQWNPSSDMIDGFYLAKKG